MTSSNDCCIYEKRLNKNENRITELEAKADFKEQRINELGHKMEEMDNKLDRINDAIQDLKIQSNSNDYNIDKRLTTVETTVRVLKWVTTILIAIIPIIITLKGV